jgi:hypothetical protein
VRAAEALESSSRSGPNGWWPDATYPIKYSVRHIRTHCSTIMPPPASASFSLDVCINFLEALTVTLRWWRLQKSSTSGHKFRQDREVKTEWAVLPAAAQELFAEGILRVA